ncbi:MAG TPA: hypothetical protein PLN21_21830 [Gemmatales bacterium]|nr:hypothetical protein [Gemmatales bacterium]
MNPLLFCLLMIGWQDPVQKPPAIQPPATKGDTLWNDVVSIEVKTYDGAPVSLEQAIKQAFVSHPDMRLAEAELRVAEAKLAQARIVVSQKVTEDFHRLEKERAEVKLATAKWQRIEQLQKKNTVSKQEVDEAQYQLAQAKTRLAAIESSWKLVMRSPAARTGSAHWLDAQFAYPEHQYPQEDAATFSRYLTRRLYPEYELFRAVPDKTDAVSADVVEQLKSKLATRVKLDKQTNIDMEQAFQKVTEGAGLKVRVRLPVTENKTLYKNITRLTLEAGEYPLRTWLQLIVDEMNSYQVDPGTLGQGGVKGYVLYVREYGLLLTTRDLAPPDAITVQELWKQSQFEKAAAEVKKVQESATPKK